MKWVDCDKCNFKSKTESNLKKHKANIHGIDVKWFKCDQCLYKCKQNSDLTRHKGRQHGSPAPPAPPALSLGSRS